MNANLYALLRDHFLEDAEQPCVLIPGGPVIHYDDLDAASARIAHALSAAGCRAGDRVAVHTEKCWQSLALYLACLRAAGLRAALRAAGTHLVRYVQALGSGQGRAADSGEDFLADLGYELVEFRGIHFCSFAYFCSI